MIYLWALGGVFLYINFWIGLYALMAIGENQRKKAAAKKEHKEEPLLNLQIEGIAIFTLIMSILIMMLISGGNRAISSRGGPQDKMIFSEFVPFNPENGWSAQQRWAFVIASSISVSLFAAIYVLFIRSLLPPRYKRFITFFETKNE